MTTVDGPSDQLHSRRRGAASRRQARGRSSDADRAILRASTRFGLRNPYFYKLSHDRPVLPDCEGTILLDLEDGVSHTEKVARRRAIASVLAQPLPQSANVLIRCNGPDAVEQMMLDLEATCCAALSGFVLPMVTRPEDVRSFAFRLEDFEASLGLANGHFAIHLLIEQPAAFLQLAELARASRRVASIMFGKEDFLARFPMGIERAADLAEAQLPLLAAALDLPAIASPYCAIDDPAGFARYCRRARGLGYSGVFTLHPAQRPIADRAFAVSAQELQTARRLLEDQHDGPVVCRDGEVVGPPMRRRAQALLDRAGSRSANAATRAGGAETRGARRTGRLPQAGLDTATAQVGSILDGPHVYTIDESHRTMWAAHFPVSDAVFSSIPAAESVGFSERPLPFSLLLNLCLCLSVEPFSQSCRYHLGLRQARQIAPVGIGDTVRVRIRVEGLRNTSAGDAAVIVTTHLLVNQRDEPVFVLTKDSYYDAIPDLDARQALPCTGAAHEMFEASLTAPALQCASGNAARHATAYLPASLPVAAGEIILHPAVRPIGWSENLELTTLVRNTHPVHFDAERYGREGIVVCGGFVQALAQGLASPQFRQVVEERLIHSFHAKTVMPEDRIGAISRVLSVRDAGEGIEEVTVSTLGLINVDVERELVGVELPEALFGPEPIRPGDLRALCAAECPELEDRIALRAVRVLRRLSV